MRTAGIIIALIALTAAGLLSRGHRSRDEAVRLGEVRKPGCSQGGDSH